MNIPTSSPSSPQGPLRAAVPNFLATGTGFVEDSFSMEREWDGFGMIQAPYIYRALHFYYHQLHLRLSGIRSQRLATLVLRVSWARSWGLLSWQKHVCSMEHLQTYNHHGFWKACSSPPSVISWHVSTLELPRLCLWHPPNDFTEVSGKSQGVGVNMLGPWDKVGRLCYRSQIRPVVFARGLAT